MQSLYNAKLGLKTQQQRMDIIANNVANVSTTAYKSQSALFKDALYTQMIDPSNVSSNANLKQGSGMLLSSTYRDFTAGTPVETGEALDVYINGDGFFSVETSSGDVMYTRNGNFSISNEKDGRYIVTAQGYYLLDSDGNRISIPEGIDSFSISETGQMTAGGTVFAVLQPVTFTNKDGLSLVGDGCFGITESSGDAQTSDAGFKQGYLESSNVDLSTEFVQMIRAQRSFSLAGRALTAWDNMESVTNNLRT